jgi:peptidoglycan hydrolase CwlO-like protein
LLLGALVTVAAAAPARADDDAIDLDPVVIQARTELQAAQAAAHAAAARVEHTTQARDDVQVAIDDHETQVATLARQREELTVTRDAIRTHVQARARALYTSGGGTLLVNDLVTKSVMQAARRQRLVDAAARSDSLAVKRLESTNKDLADTQAQLRSEQHDLEQQRGRLDTLVVDLEHQQAEMTATVEAANVALTRAREIGAFHAARDPIIGRATLTATQLSGWFRAQGYHPRLDGVTLEELAQLFLQEGADEGIRGDVMFAQSVIETGGFSSAPANNYSGIGWCDSCSRGNRFPTPRDGVRAQVQLLRNYADPFSTASRLHHPVSPYLYSGDPAVAARQFDTFYAKGWAPTWRDMGHGNWATDPNYSAKVLSVYQSIVTYSFKGN